MAIQTYLTAYNMFYKYGQDIYVYEYNSYKDSALIHKYTKPVHGIEE
jgi:hypothetical protein